VSDDKAAAAAFFLARRGLGPLGHDAAVNTPNPALVTQRAARRMPRLALLLLCAAYVLPGLFARDPWRNADITAFGYMLSLAEGRSSWLAPSLGGLPADAALLPYWLGAAFVYLLSPWVDAALAARLPFGLLLALVLSLTWYSAYQLARTEAAQPVAFAFGGEPETVDYARAIADAAVLALIASLGLLQLGHETTPEMAQLFGVSLFLWSIAAAPYRVWTARLGAMSALVLVAGSGAPFVAVAMGLGGCVICAYSAYPQVRRQAPWVAVGTLAAGWLAWALGVWAWRIGVRFDFDELLKIGRLWLWFMWPAWLLALWTLWRWRRHLQHRHVSVPLVTAGVALACSFAMGGSDGALLLGLPGLAVLAAFALPTLNRSTTAAIDWFSMILFTLCAGALWVIYLSMQTGVPAKPAANIARLAPGFTAQFSLLALLLALLASAGWIWLLRWRTGRHREALWKSLVLPAGGVALCWLLLMTLGLPILDYARSNRPIVERIARHVPAGQCIAAPGQPLALVAALEFFGSYEVDARRSADKTRCNYLVRIEPATAAKPPPDGWMRIARERRPTDRNNLTTIYRRDATR
jgi:4-amino-4-deoxy-L-arabinose transferase-like glycosyltransferase